MVSGLGASLCVKSEGKPQGLAAYQTGQERGNYLRPLSAFSGLQGYIGCRTSRRLRCFEGNGNKHEPIRHFLVPHLGFRRL